MILFLAMVFMKKFFSALFLLTSMPAAWACTDLHLQATDGTVLVGRTMDFNQDLQSAWAIYPRGEQRTSKAPNGRTGLSWTSRYAYAGMNELGNHQMISDGLNEKGLSLEDLWLAETQYPPVNANSQPLLSLYDFPAWVLGNFSSVAELKQQLPHLHLWGDKIAKLNSVVPLHFAIHDATGANIVIEFLHGHMHVLDNPLGVLTNSPPLVWQLHHAQAYLTPKAIAALPGDYSPVSRFVKGAVLIHFSDKRYDQQQSLYVMEHLLNNFDAPYGLVDVSETHPSGDYTQWTIIKDLSHQQVYLRPYQSFTFYHLDMPTVFKQVKDFRYVALSQMAEQGTIDVTQAYG